MAFDVITPYKLGQSSLTAVVATVHTVPTLERTIVKTIDICNTATTSNILIPGATITAKGMFQWGGAQVLNTGDTIQALSSTSGVNINVSGAQCT